jgi:hypothetical protein
VDSKLSVFALFAALGFLTGCSSYNVGSKYEAEPNGSYAGETLNPSVSDQNPHVGGDASFPSADTTTDKLDGR